MLKRASQASCSGGQSGRRATGSVCGAMLSTGRASNSRSAASAGGEHKGGGGLCVVVDGRDAIYLSSEVGEDRRLLSWKSARGGSKKESERDAAEAHAQQR